MIYTESVRKALSIAYHAHANQVDLGGTPFIFHPLYVAASLPDEDDAVIVAALLHDVVEKTNISLDDLICAGFSDRVIHTIDILTYNPRESYLEEYIPKIKQDPLARAIAIAAIYHNLDTERYHGIQLNEVQFDALEELDEMYEQAYRNLMKD